MSFWERSETFVAPPGDAARSASFVEAPPAPAPPSTARPSAPMGLGLPGAESFWDAGSFFDPRGTGAGVGSFFAPRGAGPAGGSFLNPRGAGPAGGSFVDPRAGSFPD